MNSILRPQVMPCPRPSSDTTICSSYNRRMNLQRARYLIALSDHGSFTRAAANVHVAQSALSQQIKVLERELGVPLVDRRGPQFTFTAAGRVAVREARFLLGCADRAVERIRLAARGVDGELRIAYTRSWAGGAVADLVSTYRKLYPGVEVVVHRGTSAQTVDLVRNGAVDIAVVRPPLDDGDRELPLIVLDTEPILVAVPADHPFGGRATVELGDLVDVPVVFWPEANAPGMYSRTLEQLWPDGAPSIVRFEADDEQVLHAVSDGVGIAPIPQGRARMLRIPGVHLCEIAGEQPTLDVAVTYRQDNPNPALAPFVALAERERSSTTA